ncbi:unnamed protein product, partial [Prorocentrum cordatum]
DFRLRDTRDYVKHILALHDGEARLVRAGWEPFPASGGSILQPCYWHYQFSRGWDTYSWLSTHKGNLTIQDLDWIMMKDGGETGLMRSDPAFGNWQIRSGQFITLAELFWFGKHLCSCYDIYRAYLSLPVWIQKRKHSTSQSAAGVLRRNAKASRHQEEGKYGLPSNPGKRGRR